MKDIQKRELLRSIKLIQSLGCSFRVITPDGESFGELKVVKPKPPRIRIRAERKYPYGSLTQHIRNYIDLNAEIGTVQEIPCGKFEVESLRSTACHILTKAWGVDSYVTVARGDYFELMRTTDSPAGEAA